jgi:hypothetical protein
MNNTELQSALRKWMSTETVEPLKTYLKTADTSQLLRLIYQLDESLLDELIKFFISPQHHAFYDQFIEAKNLLSGHLRSLFVTEPVIKKLLYLSFFKWLSVEDSDDLNLFYSKEISTSLQNEFPGILKQAVFGETIRKIKDNIILKNIDELISSASFAKKDEPLKDKKIEPVDQLYIENAGLVLLHPFLQPFFKNIHLTTNDQFADEYAAMKAVLLTQFVVYGSGVFEEHQLVLNKILCGYSLDEPIIRELEISEEEKKEATDLLHQVMQLWKKNNVRVTVTRESLQHSFLQRQGKLVQKEKDWQLHIEQKPYDMVLSSLPWGIGIIKTPWMKGMLWVDWA